MAKKNSKAPAVKIEMWTPALTDPSGLNPAKYNPRKIAPDQLAALKESIRKHGFLQALVVQKKGMIIVGGHQRLRALTELCAEAGIPVPNVPVVVLDLTDVEAKKLNLKLNRVGGEFDQAKLGELLIDISKTEPVISSPAFLLDTGFSEKEIERAMKISQPAKLGNVVPTFGTSVTLSLEFGDVATRDAVKQWLLDRTELTKKRSGECVAELIGK